MIASQDHQVDSKMIKNTRLSSKNHMAIRHVAKPYRISRLLRVWRCQKLPIWPSWQPAGWLWWLKNKTPPPLFELTAEPKGCPAGWRSRKGGFLFLFVVMHPYLIIWVAHNGKVPTLWNPNSWRFWANMLQLKAATLITVRAANCVGGG